MKSSPINLYCSPPQGFTLRPLEEKHVAKTCEAYPHRNDETARRFESLRLFNESVGAFNELDELVAWCYRCNMGALNALQVDASNYRRGFGTLVLKAIAKLLAETEEDTFGFVMTSNTPSQATFTKLGFRIIDRNHWLAIK